MDFFVVFLLGLLVPFTFNKSDIKFTPEVGFLYASNAKKGVAGTTYTATPIKSGRDFNILSATGYYGKNTSSFNYEIFLDFLIPIAVDGKVWTAIRFGYNPTKEGIDFKLARPDGKGRILTKILYTNEAPSIGIMLGYDFKSYISNSIKVWENFGFSVYGGASLLRMSFADSSNFESENVYNTSLKVYGGAKLQLDYNTKLIFQYTKTSTEIRALTALTQNFVLDTVRMNVGFSYVFTDSELKRKANKDKTYTDIFKLL